MGEREGDSGSEEVMKSSSKDASSSSSARLSTPSMNMLYEDNLLVVMLEPNPTVIGHTKVIVKRDERFLESLSELEINHLFRVGSIVATALFEALEAEGTNLVLNNGFDSSIILDIIPRRSADGLNFQWKPRDTTPDKLESVRKSLIQHTEYIGLQIPKNSVKEEKGRQVHHRSPEKVVEPGPSVEEGDYRIRQLNRIP